MKKRRGDEDRRQRHEGPGAASLAAEYRRACSHRDSNYWERQRVNYETRYCLWANQSWDGRKWAGRGGKKPFPWPGASDARVPLVDLYIREDVALMMQAWTTQRIMVRPTRPAQDAGWANQVTTLLRWLVYEEMEEAEDEADLLANSLLERGACALGVFWCKEERLTRQTITYEEIAMRSQQAMQAIQEGDPNPMLPMLADLAAAVADVTREDEVAALLVSTLGEEHRIDVPRARKIVRDLRITGVATYPRPIVAKDRPEIRALTWNEDILVPPECVRLQDARVVFLRELLTEAALEDRVRSYNYDRAWVDAVIANHRGKVMFEPKDNLVSASSALGRGEHDTSELFEVVTAYERRYDEDGISGIYCTTFHPGVRQDDATQDHVAKHELLDYAHGQQPFVEFCLERRSRLTDDSRGYGERAHTWQRQLKRQWDARIDRADVATLPPSRHPPDEEPDAWGPGVKIPTRQPELFGYFDIPRYDSGSNEVENTVREFSDRYFGRQGERPTVETMALRAELMRGWLRGWKRAFKQVVQLCQQYLPDEIWVRVVGDNQGRSMRVSREEIQGPFNITLHFHAGHLDAEFVKEKLSLLQQAMQFDVSGRLDRDEVLVAGMELIDPSYAERLIKPGDDASLEQIEDERAVLAQMLLGIGTDVRGDEAFALRRNVLESTIRQSPTVQQILQANPQAQELVRHRLQQLDFNIQQRMVNPEIGRRLGTKPVGAEADMAAAQQS